MLIFDTDVSVDIVRGFAPALLWYDSLPEPALIAGFAYMEVIWGCKDRAEARRVRQLLSPLRIVWPSETDSERALSVRSVGCPDCRDCDWSERDALHVQY